MRIIDDFSQTLPFEILCGQAAEASGFAPVAFNSPHSGCCYPFSFLASSRLDERRIRISEDALVDRLFADVVNLGAPLMVAHFPRAYIDVNREPYELDPKMFLDHLPHFANTGSQRVTGGLGTVPRVVAEGEEIYGFPLRVAEALDRINKIYKPYHARLRRLLAEIHVIYGAVLLIDCHSMPSVIKGLEKQPRVDIVLGDRFGASCSPLFVRQAEQLLRSMGYRVAVNRPYAGGFITDHYGRPGSGLHALQLEVSRGLYLDERTLEPSGGFGSLKRNLTVFSAEMIAFTRKCFANPDRAAAE